jgi:tetratricopeptide (TPR) repeat protein
MLFGPPVCVRRKFCFLVFGFLGLPLSVVTSLEAQVPNSARDKASEAYQAGMRYLHDKRYSEALDEFRLEEHYAPDLPQGATGEGIALALLGRLDEADQALTKALQIDASDWMARRELGIVEWQLGQKDPAAKELRNVVKLFPSDQAVNSLLAQYESEHKNYSQAVVYFSAAPAEVAGDAKLSLMAAEALLKTGRLDEARKELAGLSDRGNLSPDAQFQLGWLLGQAKQYKEAIQVFNSLPKDYPDRLKLSYGLALAYFEEGDYSKCIETLRPISGTPNASVLSLIGVAEEKSGHTEEAYSAFRQAIALFPTDDESYLDIATLAAVHMNYDLAMQSASIGIEKLPDDYKLLLTRGLVHNLKGQYDPARADYEKALALAPEQGSIYVALGMCYEDENKYSDAVAILQQALQRQIKDVLVYYFLADALFREGLTPDSPQFEQARSAVESGLSLDPGYAFAYLQRAKLELMTSRTEDAIVDLEHARRLEPQAQSILYQLAIAYRQVGRRAEASQLLASVVQSNKSEVEQERVQRLVGIMVDTSSAEAAGP